MNERVSSKSRFGKPYQFVRWRKFNQNQNATLRVFAFLNVWRLSPHLRGLRGCLKSARSFKPTFPSFFNLLRLRYSQEGRTEFRTRRFAASKQPWAGHHAAPDAASSSARRYEGKHVVIDARSMLIPTRAQKSGGRGQPPRSSLERFPRLDNFFPPNGNRHSANGNSILAKRQPGSPSRHPDPQTAQPYPAWRESHPG